MRKKNASELVMGVMVTARSVNAVLLRSTPRGVKPVRRFTRQRTISPVDLPGGPGAGLPDVDEADDFTIQFGEGGGSDNDLFLSSEFGSLDLPAGETAGAGGNAQTSAFILELADILDECRSAGFEAPATAFCVSATDVERVELRLPADAGSGVSRAKLLGALSQQHPDETYDAERVGFLPMTASEDGGARYLAVVPKAQEPVLPTIQAMQADQNYRLPPLRFLDAEVSVYTGLSRIATRARRKEDGLESDADSSTLVVRAGTEDTLVLFMRGDELHHCESLRSLTAFDAPETICSRVLLLQDEYGIGEVDHVVLLSEEGEAALIESFEMFFPDARVQSMRAILPAGEEDYEGDEMLVPATGVALRMVDDVRYSFAFEKVNLFSKDVLRRRVRMPVPVSSLVMLGVLFLTVMFFMWRYFSNEGAISDGQMELRTLTTETEEVSPKVLQARIDSMRATAEGIVQALEVLDELLVGSDRWSRTLENAAQQVSAVGGIWIEGWKPSGNVLNISGNATSRDHVVELAERLRADIETLSFSEIREWPVYSFQMRLQLQDDLPEAARFLREQIAAQAAAAEEAARRNAQPASLQE